MSEQIQIEIDGEQVSAPHGTATGRDLKALFGREGRLHHLRGEERIIIEDDVVLELEGGERFVTATEIVEIDEVDNRRVHEITFYVDGVAVTTNERELTGARIKDLAHRPAGNILYKVDGRERVEIADNEIVRVHENEKFITQPPVGRAS